jgi:hypothetical protein
METTANDRLLNVMAQLPSKKNDEFSILGLAALLLAAHRPPA